MEEVVEYLNYTEIVNDLLHKLTVKDVKLLRSLTLKQLYHEQHQYITHIRNFYQLDNPNNPLYSHALDDTARKVAQTVWQALRLSPYPEQSA